MNSKLSAMDQARSFFEPENIIVTIHGPQKAFHQRALGKLIMGIALTMKSIPGAITDNSNRNPIWRAIQKVSQAPGTTNGIPTGMTNGMQRLGLECDHAITSQPGAFSKPERLSQESSNNYQI